MSHRNILSIHQGRGGGCDVVAIVTGGFYLVQGAELFWDIFAGLLAD